MKTPGTKLPAEREVVCRSKIFTKDLCDICNIAEKLCAATHFCDHFTEGVIIAGTFSEMHVVLPELKRLPIGTHNVFLLVFALVVPWSSSFRFRLAWVTHLLNHLHAAIYMFWVVDWMPGVDVKLEVALGKVSEGTCWEVPVSLRARADNRYAPDRE